MGKNNKADKKAPVIETAEIFDPAKDTTVLPKKFSGMSADSKVLFVDLVQRRTVEKPRRDGVYSPEFTEQLNVVADAMLVDVAINEVACSGNSFRFIASKNPKVHEAFVKLAESMGMQIPALEALPAPTKEQLNESGMQGEDTKDKVVIEVTEKNISKEAKQAAKAEASVKNSDVELDITKFKNEDDLRKALTYMMSAKPSPFVNITEAVAMYRSYLMHNAKSDKEKEEVKNKSFEDLFTKVTEIVKNCTLVVRGFGSFLYNEVSSKKNPVSAFCILRNAAKNKETGIPYMDDETIAAMLRVIVRWVSVGKIEEQNKNIANAKSDIVTLSKDKKANKKGIEDLEEKIKTYKNNIEHINNVLSFVTNPSFDIADKFLENLSENDQEARRLFGIVTSSYYGKELVENSDMKAIRQNVQIYIGVILNFFCDAALKNGNYTESDFVEITKK